MTSINYDVIFSYFLGEMTDYGFSNFDTSDANELMSEYLHKTVAMPYIRRLFSSVTLDDEIQVLSFEMDFVNDEDADKDFITLVLSKGMLIKWLEPQVRSKVNIAQFFGGKEQNYFSQANHIAEIRGILEDVNLELRKMIRDRGYISNDYLDS